MARGFNVEVDVNQLEALAGRLGTFDGEQIGEVARASVNQVATRAYNTARARINAGLSLTDLYVQSRVQLQPATEVLRPRAVIRARGLLTSLGHYAPRQTTQPVKNPGRAKGDPARGIPKGLKPAGVSVEVVRGTRKLVRQGQSFTIPKLKDSEGNPLIFKKLRGQKTSSGKDKLVRLLGPSVYQLFRLQAEYIVNDVADDLQTTVVQQAEEFLKKVL